MKIKKKAALAAVLFSAALNTACNVYGPPEDESAFEENDTEIVSSEDVTQSNSEANTDNSETTEGEDVQ